MKSVLIVYGCFLASLLRTATDMFNTIVMGIVRVWIKCGQISYLRTNPAYNYLHYSHVCN